MNVNQERISRQVAKHLWKADGEPEKDSEPTSVGRGWYEDRAAEVVRGLAELGYVISKPRAKGTSLRRPASRSPSTAPVPRPQ